MRGEFLRTKSWVNFAGDFLVDFFRTFFLRKNRRKKIHPKVHGKIQIRIREFRGQNPHWNCDPARLLKRGLGPPARNRKNRKNIGLGLPRKYKKSAEKLENCSKAGFWEHFPVFGSFFLLLGRRNFEKKCRARHNPEPRSEVWWWNLRWSFGGKCFWRFSQQKKLENLLPDFAGSSPPVSPKTSPTSLWKSPVLKLVRIFGDIRSTWPKGPFRTKNAIALKIIVKYYCGSILLSLPIRCHFS